MQETSCYTILKSLQILEYLSQHQIPWTFHLKMFILKAWILLNFMDSSSHNHKHTSVLQFCSSMEMQEILDTDYQMLKVFSNICKQIYSWWSIGGTECLRDHLLNQACTKMRKPHLIIYAAGKT